jgi:hypothetical protein
VKTKHAGPPWIATAQRFVRLGHRTEVTWKSPLFGTFEAMAAAIEARLGPPAQRDLDSNGIGLFDYHLLRFACGLEIALYRYHLGSGLRAIDAAREASLYEIYTNRPELEHAVFHLGIAAGDVQRATAADGSPLVAPVSPSVVVMRRDDNGNEREVTRVTNRCEADAVAAAYRAHGHKQTYWVLA